MSGQPEACEDVREALILLLARVDAAYLTVGRLNEWIDEQLMGAAWDLAAKVYGIPEGGSVLERIGDRLDPIEDRELAALVERLHGTRPAPEAGARQPSGHEGGLTEGEAAEIITDLARQLREIGGKIAAAYGHKPDPAPSLTVVPDGEEA